MKTQPRGLVHTGSNPDFVQFAGLIEGAREHAEQDGWVRVNGKDYCRDHKRFHRAELERKGDEK